jgi:hypothetical protein
MGKQTLIHNGECDAFLCAAKRSNGPYGKPLPSYLVYIIYLIEVLYRGGHGAADFGRASCPPSHNGGFPDFLVFAVVPEPENGFARQCSKLCNNNLKVF